MMRVEFKVDDETDRVNLVTALAKNGYRVKVIKRKDADRHMAILHYVEVEVDMNDVKYDQTR